MKTFFVLLLICFFQAVNAASYYFSTSLGDDSRSPTEAQNSSTPWKTLDKLNSFFDQLQPGDFVLLKRGERFFGSINVKKSGTPASPITISAYGPGNMPVISSIIKVSDWVFKGKGIWESYKLPLLSPTIRTVLLNGKEQNLGRFPNIEIKGNNGYLNFESHDGTSSITDDDFNHTANWAGAEVVIRSRRWTLDRKKIISNTQNKIVYIPAGKYLPYDNQGYFIQNHLKTLDKFGEWYYNPATRKLSVYFGLDSPSSYTIQVPTFNNLIYSSNFSNVVFHHLDMRGANNSCVFIKSGSNITVKNCSIRFSGQDGVEVKLHKNFTLYNCTVSNSNNDGISLGYGVDSATIKNNKIRNTSLFAGMGNSGDGQGLGIHSQGNGNIIEYNEIRNTGYIGIHFDGNNVVVKNNLIDNFCKIKDDGAGIYSHVGSPIRRTGRKVIGNIILNGRGAPKGTNNPAYSPAEGIYMDNDASDVEIRGNTIANCKNNGIYIHNAYEIVIKNNTIFNNTKQLNIIEDADHSRVRKCEFSNNIFFSKFETQLMSNVKTSGNDVNLLGNFNNNYYARPINDKLGIFSSYATNDGERFSEKLDLREWQSKFGQDKNSRRAAKQIVPYKVNKLIGPNKVGNGAFSSNINGIHKNSCTIIWGDSGLPDGRYVKVTPTKRNSLVFINLGEVKAGRNYILKYSLRGSGDGSTTISTFLRQNGSPYKSLTPVQLRKAATTRRDIQMLFSMPTNEASASIVFRADNKKNEYYLDNIEFYEADALIANLNEEIKFVYNATTLDQTISLNASYVDVRGKQFSHSITLKPFTSAVLIKNGDNPPENVAAKENRSLPQNNQNNRPKESSASSGTTESTSIGGALKPLYSTTLSLTLSPNPANNILNIVTKGLKQEAIMQISVISGSGILMKTLQTPGLNQNIKLDVSSFARGVYSIRILCGDKTLNKQFVKL